MFAEGACLVRDVTVAGTRWEGLDELFSPGNHGVNDGRSGVVRGNRKQRARLQSGGSGFMSDGGGGPGDRSRQAPMGPGDAGRSIAGSKGA